MARWIFVLVLCGVAGRCLAQTALSVRGTVVDATGAGIAGAEVRLEGAGGGVEGASATDGKGQFTLTNVRAGEASLVVPAFSGFAMQTMALRLTGSIAGVVITLRPEAVAQDVSVDATATLSTDAAANRDTITTTGEELRRLPVFDQDAIAALTPFLDGATGSSGGGTILVDGVEMKRSGVSASAIQEVRTNNDPYSAEFTRPGRGRIEIITKPGSPEFHGEVNFLVRDASLNAKNYFAVVRPPETRRIYEGHLSGPAGAGGRTRFIVSGSYREQNTAVAVSAVGPNGPVNENVLTPNRDAEFSGRVNHDFSETHRLSVGYNFESSRSTNAGVGGIVLPEAGYNQSGREDDVILNDRLIVTPNLVNQLQVTLEKDEDVTRSVTEAQSIDVSGSFVGGGAQADVAKTENTVHVNEVVTWSRGRQTIRAGVQLPQFSRRAVDDRTNRLGTFRFASLANYAGGTPYVFTAQQGVGRGLYWINEFGSFVQDQVKLSARVQVSLGLRYDWQTFLPDNNNLAPRVSVAYAPGKGGTVVRVGTGVFYDRTGGDFPATAVLHDGVILQEVQVQNPTFPLGAGIDVGALPTNLVRFSRQVRAPYAVQYSAGVERQLGHAVTVTAGYRGQVQVKSFRSRDANAPVLPANPDLNATYARPDARFGQIQQIESGGRTLLNAMDLSFHGQAGQWFSGQAQYTLSRYASNTGGISAFPQDQYRPNAEWGRANTDRLQRFNLIGTIHPDHWLSLGVDATLYSGLPYTEITGDDFFHTGLGNARPAGVGRNTRETGGVASLDLLYDHDFRLTGAKGEHAKILSAGVSAFNVLNRTNYTSYIGTLSSTRFGRPTAALAGRQLQLSVGYRF